jgi:predicted ATP-grasp superfamily ATP-dependent carboligase
LQERIEAMVERDKLREEAPLIRKEIQRLRDELDQNLQRRDELNIIINGEGFE